MASAWFRMAVFALTLALHFFRSTSLYSSAFSSWSICFSSFFDFCWHASAISLTAHALRAAFSSAVSPQPHFVFGPSHGADVFSGNEPTPEESSGGRGITEELSPSADGPPINQALSAGAALLDLVAFAPSGAEAPLLPRCPTISSNGTSVSPSPIHRPATSASEAKTTKSNGRKARRRRPIGAAKLRVAFPSTKVTLVEKER
jgi:hypothetical protein